MCKRGLCVQLLAVVHISLLMHRDAGARCPLILIFKYLQKKSFSATLNNKTKKGKMVCF